MWKKTDPPYVNPRKIRPPLLDPSKKPDHQTKSNELAVKLGMCGLIILKYVFFAKKYDSLAISKFGYLGCSNGAMIDLDIMVGAKKNHCF